MKKKILHLITGLELGGGAENMLLQLLPDMRKDFDNKVCVIIGHGEIGKRLESNGIPVEYLDLGSIVDFGAVLRYRKIVKSFRPDVQVHYLIHADLFGRVFGRLFGVRKMIPYIRNIHRQRKLLMFLDRLTLPLAYFVLTNSETAKAYYIATMGVSPAKIRCIPNGVDLSRFSSAISRKTEKRRELGIPEGSLIVGSVARLEKQKDLQTLIRAFASVVRNGIDASLALVGHGREEDRLRSLSNELGISEKVFFLKKRRDLPEIIRLFDVFVLPSLNEGMSNALLEAMAAKRIIITSDIGENAELIVDEECGLCFKQGDAGELSWRLMSVLRNKHAVEFFGENAFRRVKDHYDIRKVRGMFISFLNAI